MTSPRYSERVLALFRDLPNAGELSVRAGRAVSGEAVALDRCAWVRFDARVQAGRLVDCRFRAFGCPHTLAAAALTAGWLARQPDGRGVSVAADALARELDVPTEKMGRMLVVEDAARALLAEAARVQ